MVALCVRHRGITLTPKFVIVHENGKYVVRDEDGVNYGKYDKKAEAEQVAEDWVAYYNEGA